MNTYEGCRWLRKGVHILQPWASALSCSHSSTTQLSLVFRHLGNYLGSSLKYKAVLAFLALDFASSLLSIFQHRTHFTAELHRTSLSLLSGPKELEDVQNVLLTPDLIWTKSKAACGMMPWRCDGANIFPHHTNGELVALSSGSGKVERDFQPPQWKSPL